MHLIATPCQGRAGSWGFGASGQLVAIPLGPSNPPYIEAHSAGRICLPSHVAATTSDPAYGCTRAMPLLAHRRSVTLHRLDGVRVARHQAERIGSRDPCMASHGCFPAAGDDERKTFASSDDDFAQLADIVPALKDTCFATLASRKQHEDELERLVADWTRTTDRWYVTRLLQAPGRRRVPELFLQGHHQRSALERLRIRRPP